MFIKHMEKVETKVCIFQHERAQGMLTLRILPAWLVFMNVLDDIDKKPVLDNMHSTPFLKHFFMNVPRFSIQYVLDIKINPFFLNVSTLNTNNNLTISQDIELRSLILVILPSFPKKSSPPDKRNPTTILFQLYWAY